MNRMLQRFPSLASFISVTVWVLAIVLGIAVNAFLVRARESMVER